MITKTSLQPALGWRLSIAGVGVIIAMALLVPMLVARLLRFEAEGFFAVAPVIVVALWSGVIPAVGRVFLYWPGGTSKYAKFLVTSPWDLRHPLLMGPFHLTIGDFAVALLAGVSTLLVSSVQPMLCILLPLAALLLCHGIAWWGVVMIEPASKRMWGRVTSSFYWLPAGLVPLLLTTRVYPPVAYVGVLIAALLGWQVTLYLLSRRVLADFPWHSLFFSATEADERKRRALKAAGWPFEALAPDAARLNAGDAPRLLARPMITGALIATLVITIGVCFILVAWLGADLASQRTRPVEGLLYARWQFEPGKAMPGILAPIILFSFALAVHGQQMRGTRAPHSLVFHVTHLRLPSWSYLRAIVIPLALFVVVAASASALLLTPIPMIVVLWGEVFTLMVAWSYIGPRQETWRLTADLVEVRKVVRLMRQSSAERKAIKQIDRDVQKAAPAVSFHFRRVVEATIIIALIVGCIAGLELGLHSLRAVGYLGSLDGVLRIAIVGPLCGWATFHFARHRVPLLNPAYEQWLATTAWTPGRQLPMGPVRPTWFDLCWLAPLTLWMGHFSGWQWYAVLTPVGALLAAWMSLQWTAMAVYYARARAYAWRLRLVELLMFSLFFSWYSPWLVITTVGLAYALLQLDVNRVMRQFPFNTSWWQGASQTTKPIDVVGWPWNAIAPFAETPAPWRPVRALVSAVLVFWVVFAMLWPVWQRTDGGIVGPDWEVRYIDWAFGILTFVFSIIGWIVSENREQDDVPVRGASLWEQLLATEAVKDMDRFGSRSSPLSFFGRFATGRLVSWHDAFWVLPVLFGVLVGCVASLGMWYRVPMVVLVPLALAINVVLISWMRSITRRWRYLAPSRYVKSSDKSQQLHQTDEPGGAKGFRGMETKLWGSS